jgi:hypothetical protein
VAGIAVRRQEPLYFHSARRILQSFATTTQDVMNTNIVVPHKEISRAIRDRGHPLAMNCLRRPRLKRGDRISTPANKHRQRGVIASGAPTPAMGGNVAVYVIRPLARPVRNYSAAMKRS